MTASGANTIVSSAVKINVLRYGLTIPKTLLKSGKLNLELEFAIGAERWNVELGFRKVKKGTF
jgi:hypothetical protein